MSLTKKQKNEYKLFLETNATMIKMDFCALTKRQQKFVGLVAIIANAPPGLKLEDIGRTTGMSGSSIDRAIKVIKSCVLPYRRTDRMLCRLMEIKSMGKVGETIVRNELSKLQKLKKFGREYYVYFILWSERNLVKIGRGSARRIHEIQTFLPFDTEVVCKILVQSKSTGSTLEASLHKTFKSSKFKSEWFKYGDEIKKYISVENGLKTKVGVSECRGYDGTTGWRDEG
jgi:hypothetical protein